MLSGVGSRKSGVMNASSDSGLRSSDFRIETYRYYTIGLGKQRVNHNPLKMQ